MFLSQNICFTHTHTHTATHTNVDNTQETTAKRTNTGYCCSQDTDENGKTGGEVEVLLQCVAKEEMPAGVGRFPPMET